MKDIKPLGYLKYSGESVKEGYLDARKSAQALLGFDEALRFYVTEFCPYLKKADFEVPVRVNKGSWEALIPETIETWIMAGAGGALTTYAVTAAKKMAENDFKELGLKEIFKKALSGIQWFIQIGVHIGNTTKKKFEGVRWRNSNEEIRGRHQTDSWMPDGLERSRAEG